MMAAHTPSHAGRPLRGYIEGYYGRLLRWEERRELLKTLQRLAMSTYLYAPKEDPCHRFRWREPYDAGWLADWRSFCDDASALDVQVIAGVAPGLDFDYRDLAGGADLDRLRSKCETFLEEGASGLCLLLDDIPEKLDPVAGIAEGQAHARLANHLGDALGQPLWVVPRVYADEIGRDSPDYLAHFRTELDSRHTILYSGAQIVAHRVTRAGLDAALGTAHAVIVWDNLYANDYCPRRLFAGPWHGRDRSLPVLLNPTGLPRTDALLLALVAAVDAAVDADAGLTCDAWWRVLSAHGVPAAFAAIAGACWHPHFSDGATACPPAPEALSALYPGTVDEALDTLLWRWKGELSREWYVYLMGLKQDMLMGARRYSDTAIRKTQNAPLAERLLHAGDAGGSAPGVRPA